MWSNAPGEPKLVQIETTRCKLELQVRLVAAAAHDSIHYRRSSLTSRTRSMMRHINML